MTAREPADQGEGVGLAEVLWRAERDAQPNSIAYADTYAEEPSEYRRICELQAAAVLVAGWVRAEDVAEAQGGVRAYLDNAGITAETLRYAATHEALCRSWIFDLLTGLADTLNAAALRPVDAPEVGGRGE